MLATTSTMFFSSIEVVPNVNFTRIWVSIATSLSPLHYAKLHFRTSARRPTSAEERSLKVLLVQMPRADNQVKKSRLA